MNCCFPYLMQMCPICYNPCSLFELISINDDAICAGCYKLINEAKLDPDYKKAHKYNEKYKWYIDTELYRVRGSYILNKWGLVVGDIINNKVIMRTFLPNNCFLCKGKVCNLHETHINGYLYHYTCSKLTIL